MASNVPPGAMLSPDGRYWWNEPGQDWVEVYDDGQPDDGSQMSTPATPTAPAPDANAAPATQATSGADPNAHTAMTDTGAHPEQVPATFAVGGLPAFEFEFPASPVMKAEVDTGAALIELELQLTGKVELSFPEHESAATLTPEGFQLAAEEAVGGITHGTKVTGLGGEHVGLESSWGNQFAQSAITFEPPNGMKFEGHVQIDYTYHGSHGTPVHVKGSGGYELKVKVTPHSPPQTEVVDQESWFEAHQTQLIAVGVATLFVVGAVVVIAASGGSAAPAVAAFAVAL